MKKNENTPKHRCITDVPNTHSVTFHRCTRRGVVQRTGQWFCRQHDPVAKDARRKAGEPTRKEAHRKRIMEFRGPHWYKVLKAISEGATNPMELASKAIESLPGEDDQ